MFCSIQLKYINQKLQRYSHFIHSFKRQRMIILIWRPYWIIIFYTASQKCTVAMHVSKHNNTRIQTLRNRELILKFIGLYVSQIKQCGMGTKKLLAKMQYSRCLKEKKLHYLLYNISDLGFESQKGDIRSAGGGGRKAYGKQSGLLGYHSSNFLLIRTIECSI